MPSWMNRKPTTNTAAVESETVVKQGEGDAVATPAQSTPSIYGGSYDKQIGEAYDNVVNREKFSYDVDGDALWQQYKDRYTDMAKRGMKDSMGQAAALTGGYGSSYGQAVGQQTYDEAMKGLTDIIPQLEQNAYSKYKDEGAELKDRYNMLNDLGQQEAATKSANYSRVYNSILQTGRIPDASELEAAGMTETEAAALRQAWITNNPGGAYIAGAISADQYAALTGEYPMDYMLGGMGGIDDSSYWNQLSAAAQYVADNKGKLTNAEINSGLINNINNGIFSAADVRENLLTW